MTSSTNRPLAVVTGASRAFYGPSVPPDQLVAVPLAPGRYQGRSVYHEPGPHADVAVALTQLLP